MSLLFFPGWSHVFVSVFFPGGPSVRLICQISDECLARRHSTGKLDPYQFLRRKDTELEIGFADSLSSRRWKCSPILRLRLFPPRRILCNWQFFTLQAEEKKSFSRFADDPVGGRKREILFDLQTFSWATPDVLRLSTYIGRRRSLLQLSEEIFFTTSDPPNPGIKKERKHETQYLS